MSGMEIKLSQLSSGSKNSRANRYAIKISDELIQEIQTKM